MTNSIPPFVHDQYSITINEETKYSNNSKTNASELLENNVINELHGIVICLAWSNLQPQNNVLPVGKRKG